MIVTEWGAQALAHPREPAFGGAQLVFCLALPVAATDKLGRECDDLSFSRFHDGGSEQRMGVTGRAVCMVTHPTVVTADSLAAKVFGAVDGEKHISTDGAKLMSSPQAASSSKTASKTG